MRSGIIERYKNPLFSPLGTEAWIPWVVSSVATDVLKIWKSYLKPLLARTYRVSNGRVYLPKTRNINKGRVIDIAYHDNDTKNTLDRELRVRIATLGDNILSSQYEPLQTFEKILLHCAWDEKHRGFLHSLQSSLESIKVNDLCEVQVDHEQQAEKIYNEFRSTIWLSNEEEKDFLQLSWEDKQNFSHIPYLCRCWLIQVCIIDMIDLEKE